MGHTPELWDRPRRLFAEKYAAAVGGIRAVLIAMGIAAVSQCNHNGADKLRYALPIAVLKYVGTQPDLHARVVACRSMGPETTSTPVLSYAGIA